MIKQIKQFSVPLTKLPITVWGLAVVSMFSNISSVIVSSLTPALVIDVLGGDVAIMGIIRCATEALAFFVKLFAGILSDYFGKRKILVLIGYAAAVLVKPIFATATSILGYATAQTIDRFTNGLRDSPRDALVSDAAPKNLKGASFGVRQCLSAFGSALGGIIGYQVMILVGGENITMVRSVYWFTMIPLTICVLILLFFVHDHKNTPKLRERKGFPIKIEDMKQLGMDYWYFMFTIFVFMSVRCSEVFLIFRAKELGLEIKYSTIILALVYLATAITSHIVGILSDGSTGRKKYILIGFLLLFVSYILLAISNNCTMVFIGVLIYGCHYGTVQTSLFAMVSDYTPKHIRGTSFGILNLVLAGGMLLSSFAGIMWKVYGAYYTYLFMATVVLFATCLFSLTKNPTIKQED